MFGPPFHKPHKLYKLQKTCPVRKNNQCQQILLLQLPHEIPGKPINPPYQYLHQTHGRTLTKSHLVYFLQNRCEIANSRHAHNPVCCIPGRLQVYETLKLLDLHDVFLHFSGLKQTHTRGIRGLLGLQDPAKHFVSVRLQNQLNAMHEHQPFCGTTIAEDQILARSRTASKVRKAYHHGGYVDFLARICIGLGQDRSDGLNPECGMVVCLL